MSKPIEVNGSSGNSDDNNGTSPGRVRRWLKELEGSLITIATVVGAMATMLGFFWIMYSDLRGDIKDLRKEDLKAVNDKLDKLKDNVKNLEEQLENVCRRVNDLQGDALIDFYRRCHERGGTPDRNQKVCILPDGDTQRFLIISEQCDQVLVTQ